MNPALGSVMAIVDEHVDARILRLGQTGDHVPRLPEVLGAGARVGENACKSVHLPGCLAAADAVHPQSAIRVASDRDTAPGGSSCHQHSGQGPQIRRQAEPADGTATRSDMLNAFRSQGEQ